MLGLETAVPLTLALVRAGVIDLARAVALLTAGPARLFGLDRDGAGHLAIGGPADLAVLDLDREWIVDRADVQSKSRNTPFHGQPVKGRAVLTLLGGAVTHDLEGVLR
jgi:dihydroorotase